MTYQEDFTGFFDDDEFGVTAIYSSATYADVHPSSKSTDVNGLFEEDVYVQVNNIEEKRPVFTCAFTDLDDDEHGAKLRIPASALRFSTTDVDYTVRGFQPDGTGMVLLILEAP